MNGNETLSRMKAQGLTAWQAEFAKSFIDDTTYPFQILTAPPGTGKSRVGAAIVTDFTNARPARVLVLVPALVLRMQWVHRIREMGSQSEVRVVDQKGYRQLLDSSPLGQSAWTDPGIYLLSMDFAKKQEIASSLTTIRWDLVVVDEAHRVTSPLVSVLLKRLIQEGVVDRLLLLTSVRTPALEDWVEAIGDLGPHPVAFKATEWSGPLVQWDGSTVERPEVSTEVVPYCPRPDELNFLGRLNDAIPLMRKALGPDGIATAMLRRRAASSLFAVEQSLRTLQNQLSEKTIRANPHEGQQVRDESRRPFESIEEAGMPGDLPRVDVDPTHALALIDECLEALELIETDSKLTVVKQLIERIRSTGSGEVFRLCVLTSFADTAMYVASALVELDQRVQKLTGTMLSDARWSSMEQFQKSGGIIVCTDAMLQGTDLPDIRDILHYDLPGSPLVLQRRLGQFDRYGRSGPYQMYLLRDESGTLDDGTQHFQDFILSPGASKPATYGRFKTSQGYWEVSSSS